MSTEPRKVALIGCGHIAAAHLAAWKIAPHGKVTTLFDVTRELADKRSEEFGVTHVAATLDEALALADVIDVCTPPHTHADIAGRVLKAGRHLLIEKPVVTSVTDWDAVRAVAGKQTIGVVHNLKFTHAVQQAKQWVDEGRIGEVLRLHRLFLTSPYGDRMLVGDKHWSHKLPGGRWFETLPHELYLTHMFAGPLPVASVTALHTKGAVPGAPADEVCVVLAGGRCISTFHYSASSKENRRSLEIFGTEGKIEIDVLSDTATLAAAKDSRVRRAVGVKNVETGQRLLQAIPDRAEYLLRRAQRETPHAAIIRAFDKHLAGEGPSPTPLDEVDYVIRTGELIGKQIDAAVGRG
ncbi:MAG: Gfo/Idh/MocA family oxidoreductase [Deltaproteobacteria bacterium]|nr:Gfo/Idh/MocA family oxidoreductase [Deltaproteobacteria bacterium]